MGKRSRDKGKRGEREAVSMAKVWWAARLARRAQQVDGGLSADIVNALPEAHVEVKRYSRIAATRFYEQAAEDAQTHEFPVVLMREDGGPWLVMFRMEDSRRFAQALATQYLENRKAPDDNPPA